MGEIVADTAQPVQGAIVPTPGKALAYAVVVRRRQVILRSEPVESVEAAQRMLRRLLAEAVLG